MGSPVLGPAPDSEQGAEEACDETYEDEAHG